MCDDNVKKCFTISGALLVFLIGVGLVAGAGMSLKSKHLPNADAMINANTSNGDGLAVDLTKTMKVSLALGVFAMMGSILGCIGIATKHKMFLCGYVAAALGFAAIFLAVGISMFMMMESVEPTVARQLKSVCDADNYEQIKLALTVKNPQSCADPTAPANEVTARQVTAAAKTQTTVTQAGKQVKVTDDLCGPGCEKKIELINKLGGCKFLDMACKKKTYAFVGEGFCLVNGALPPSFKKAPVELKECKDTCDNDIECTGIVTEDATKTCSVITGAKNTPKDGVAPKGAGWTLVDTGGKATLPIASVQPSANQACFKKDVGKLVERLQRYGTIFFYSCISFGSVLMLSVCCTFSYMFGVNNDRKGKPSFPELCCAMFCPCCVAKKEDYDEVEESGSDGGEE